MEEPLSPTMSSPSCDLNWRNPSTLNPHPRGLQNKSKKLCYQNATLVLLFHTPGFLNWAADTFGNRIPHQTSPMYTAYLFHGLAEMFWTSDAESRGEKDDKLFMKLVHLFWKYSASPEWLGMNEQQDAQEYLAGLLRCLEPDAYNVLSPASFSSPTPPTFPTMPTVKSVIAMSYFCLACNTLEVGSRDTLDIRYFLMGHLPDQLERCPMESAIARGLTPLSTGRKCSSCQEGAYTMESILQAPEILFIHVNRHAEDRTRNKILTPIKLEKGLSLPVRPQGFAAEEITRAYYELYGIIFHVGFDTKFGHYVAAVRAPHGGWMWFDDEWSGPVTEEFLDERQDTEYTAYIIAYKKLWEAPEENYLKQEQEHEPELESPSPASQHVPGPQAEGLDGIKQYHTDVAPEIKPVAQAIFPRNSVESEIAEILAETTWKVASVTERSSSIYGEEQESLGQVEQDEAALTQAAKPAVNEIPETSGETIERLLEKEERASIVQISTVNAKQSTGTDHSATYQGPRRSVRLLAKEAKKPATRNLEPVTGEPFGKSKSTNSGKRKQGREQPKDVIQKAEPVMKKIRGILHLPDATNRKKNPTKPRAKTRTSTETRAESNNNQPAAATKNKKNILTETRGEVKPLNTRQTRSTIKKSDQEAPIEEGKKIPNQIQDDIKTPSIRQTRSANKKAIAIKESGTTRATKNSQNINKASTRTITKKSTSASKSATSTNKKGGSEEPRPPEVLTSVRQTRSVIRAAARGRSK